MARPKTIKPVELYPHWPSPEGFAVPANIGSVRLTTGGTQSQCASWSHVFGITSRTRGGSCAAPPRRWALTTSRCTTCCADTRGRELSTSPRSSWPLTSSCGRCPERSAKGWCSIRAWDTPETTRRHRKKNPRLTLCPRETRMEALPWNQPKNRMEPGFSLLGVETGGGVSKPVSGYGVLYSYC